MEPVTDTPTGGDVLPAARPRRSRWANRGWLVAAGALVTWALVVALRVWLPSLVHILGEPGITAAGRRGLFAAVWFLPAAAVVLVLPRVGPRPVWRAAVALLVVARIVLQLVDGGTPQLVVSGVAVAAGAVALVAFAAGAPSGHLARVGIVLGLGLEMITHAAFGTYDLAWRTGPGATAVAVAFGAIVVVVTERAARVPLWWPTPADEAGTLSPVWTRGTAWSWLGVGPAIALVGILVSPTARLGAAGGLELPAAVLLLTVAASAAFVAAAMAPSLGARTSGRLGAVLVLATTALALEPVGVSSVAAQVGLLVAVGFTLGAPTSPRDDGPRRRGAAVTVSLLLFVAITFTYYASYEVPFRLDNDVVLAAAAAILAILAFTAARDPLQLRPNRSAPMRTVALTACGVLLAGAAAATSLPRSLGHDPGTGDGTSVRVATFNVRSGFDASGRFDPDGLAEQIIASGADVIVLNEVDRGWLLEGGHDLLRLLADRTGTAATFAPAADELWGNAVLSRLPVDETRVVPLPRAGAAMPRSLVSLVVDVGEGVSIAVVGTQLHGLPGEPTVRLTQARAVTAEVARLRGRGLPVAVLGDLGTERDAPELAPLTLLADAVQSGGPTWPAEDPVVRRDHVLVSPELLPTEPSVPDATGSDHLPVIVTLRLLAVPDPGP